MVNKMSMECTMSDVKVTPSVKWAFLTSDIVYQTSDITETLKNFNYC